MRLVAVLLLLATLGVALPANAQKKARSVRKAQVPLLIDSADYLAASKEVIFCGGKSEKPHALRCDSEWRGIRWSIYNGMTGEIKNAGGTPWMFHCRYDAIENEDRCHFTTGDQFALAFMPGQHIWLNWGLQRYPGSEMVARLDDQPAISTTAEDGWPYARSAAIFRQMMVGRIMRYRWSDWPEKANHDGEIDLTGFADAAALMKAINDEFQVMRITGALSG